jgi:hypothetical protein
MLIGLCRGFGYELKSTVFLLPPVTIINLALGYLSRGKLFYKKESIQRRRRSSGETILNCLIPTSLNYTHVHRRFFLYCTSGLYKKECFFFASAAALSEVYKSRQILCCSLRIRYDSDVRY